MEEAGMRRRLCSHYLLGRCTFGSRCRFSHEKPHSTFTRAWQEARGHPTAAHGLNGTHGHAGTLHDGTANGGRVRDACVHRWQDTDRNSLRPRGHLRIMSYNVLGRSLAYAHRYLYRCVPDEYLEWSHRWGCILRELDTVRPDVVCMQEVEVPVLAQIQADMAARGYEGRYSKRADPREDGCGTFWRRDALKLIDQRAISFQALDLRENTALVLAFETRDSWGGASGHLRDPERRVLVGNTHVLFNPRSGCTKVAQVRVLMNAVAAMRERLGGCPACVCGDFNAAPGSPIYQFSRDGELRCAAYDRRRMSGQLEGAAWGWPRGLGKILREESDAGVFKAEGGGVISLSAASGNAASTCEQGREERTSSDSGTWADEQIDRACGSPEEEADLLGAGGVGRGVARHALAGALASTYAAVLGREPKYTSCHSQFFGALDYMWFTKAGAGAAGLTPLRVLLPPPPESLEVGLPDANWGSDHCSIAADFAIAGARGRL